tara:strand:+ start:49 stop:387 length:339 start_codon:yes stop_codon:yes gene_type:complete
MSSITSSQSLMGQEIGKLLIIPLIFFAGPIEPTVLELELADQKDGPLNILLDSSHCFGKLPLEVIYIMYLIHTFLVQRMEIQISQMVLSTFSFSNVAGILAINPSTVILSRW